MALDFPNSPTIGQVYPSPTIPGTPVWKWDGTAWVVVPGSSSGGLPEAPGDGQVYGRNGNTSSWVATLPIAGGTLTGNLTLNADPTTPLGAATKEYVDTHGGGGGIPEAPTDGQIYGRQGSTTSWQPQPAPATAVPLIESGSGAVGTSTLYARQDHVHPASGGGGGASVTISDTPPASPTAGSLWWKSSTGQFFIYYNDGTSSQWVTAVAVADPSNYVPANAGVRYDLVQSLTTAQQTQARQNIAADYAVKADQQTGTATTKVVSPAHQQDHDSAAKASVYLTVSAGAVTVQESYNVSGVTRPSAGVFNITFTIPFANTNYRGVGAPESSTLNMGLTATGTPTKTVSVFQFATLNAATGAPADPQAFGAVFFGRQ